jgi:hypothetical protein
MTKANPYARFATITALVLCLGTVALPVRADRGLEEEVGEGSVLLDLLLLRPIGLFSVVVGGVLYVGLVPFTLPTGNLKTSFKLFVRKPVSYTFARDLGEPRP